MRVGVSAAPTTSATVDISAPPRMATVASNLQERAMHGSELPPLAAPPISIPCGGCRSRNSRPQWQAGTSPGSFPFEGGAVVKTPLPIAIGR